MAQTFEGASDLVLQKYRDMGRPKPHHKIICPSCFDTEVRVVIARNFGQAPDYYWRNYKCKCGNSFWVGVDFNNPPDLVYSSVSPRVTRFYKYTVLYSQEDVENRKSRETSLPFNSSTIVCRRPWNNATEAREYVRVGLAEWQKANHRIQSLFTEQELQSKFTKSYAFYLKWLPEKPSNPDAMIIVDQAMYPKPLREENIVTRYATSEVATPKPQELEENEHLRDQQPEG